MIYICEIPHLRKRTFNYSLELYKSYLNWINISRTYLGFPVLCYTRKLYKIFRTYKVKFNGEKDTTEKWQNVEAWNVFCQSAPVMHYAVIQLDSATSTIMYSLFRNCISSYHVTTRLIWLWDDKVCAAVAEIVWYFDLHLLLTSMPITI